jgi:hypothetical protein
MKHVIVIETPDRKWDAKDKVIFSNRIETAVEAIAEHYLGDEPCVVRSMWFRDSAIAAVHELYNAPKWNGGL